MKKNWIIFALLCLALLVVFIFFYNKKPTAQGQQYIDGKLEQPLTSIQLAPMSPLNIPDYQQQIRLIEQFSPSLFASYQEEFANIEMWINGGASTDKLTEYNLAPHLLAGVDNYGNTHLTGYYTPVLEARHLPDEHFRYPLYGMPVDWNGRLPTRGEIYAGVLDGKSLELAYTRSLMDNFIMEVQGSGYIDFADGEPLTFFSYRGKNGHRYQSIGRLLIEQGAIDKDKVSIQAIKAWAELQEHDTVVDLLKKNDSFVFFYPQFNAPVIGSTGIPLIAKASVASDRSLVPSGSILLVEVPLLDEKGIFKGNRELRLMVALDVGGAIKGHHLDIYQGIGEEAGEQAGFYNHYGRVWILKKFLRH